MASARQSTPESAAQGNTLRTPPYTPNFPNQRLPHSNSPGSVHSVHPTETVSPAKKAEQQPADDDIKVEELTEADAGYTADTDIIYPEELEEAETSGDETSSSSDDDDASDVDITEHFSRLDCVDGAEAEFERKRRAKHARKRTDSKLFKRPHSASVEDDAEVIDADAMGDHDRSASARRLRRRTRAESGVYVVYDEASPRPPRSRRLVEAKDMHDREQPRTDDAGDTETSSNAGAMDVDESG